MSALEKSGWTWPSRPNASAAPRRAFRPWIGVRADNAFNTFLPSDVQANLGSPDFGALYNSPYRQFRLQVRFER